MVLDSRANLQVLHLPLRHEPTVPHRQVRDVIPKWRAGSVRIVPIGMTVIPDGAYISRSGAIAKVIGQKGKFLCLRFVDFRHRRLGPEQWVRIIGSYVDVLYHTRGEGW